MAKPKSRQKSKSKRFKIGIHSKHSHKANHSRHRDANPLELDTENNFAFVKIGQVLDNPPPLSKAFIPSNEPAAAKLHRKQIDKAMSLLAKI